MGAFLKGKSTGGAFYKGKRVNAFYKGKLLWGSKPAEDNAVFK